MSDRDVIESSAYRYKWKEIERGPGEEQEDDLYIPVRKMVFEREHGSHVIRVEFDYAGNLRDALLIMRAGRNEAEKCWGTHLPCNRERLLPMYETMDPDNYVPNYRVVTGWMEVHQAPEQY